jgi:hypothetical protein
VDTNELGFNAWILVGNVLHTFLRGARAHQPGIGDQERTRLAAMDALIAPVEPQEMLKTLTILSDEDRLLLVQLCTQTFILTGTEAHAVLGLDERDAAPVLAFLRNPASMT